jgi:adenylate cyclase class 2
MNQPVEKEVKFLLLDPERFDLRMQNLGARLVSNRVFEYNLRFDTQDGILLKKRQVLRLRKDENIRLTYKDASESRTDIASRTEIEINVSDFERTRALLEALGYITIAVYEKYRTTWEFGQCEVTLDELPCGFFVEVEGPDANKIHQVVEKIGLKWEKRILIGILAIYASLRSLKSLPSPDLTFAGARENPVSIQDMAKIGIYPAD